MTESINNSCTASRPTSMVTSLSTSCTNCNRETGSGIRHPPRVAAPAGKGCEACLVSAAVRAGSRDGSSSGCPEEDCWLYE